MSTQELILKIKLDKDQNNNSKDIKMILIVLIQKQDGHTTLLQPPRVLLLHHLGGDHPTAGGQHGIGALHHGPSNRFFFSSRCENFRLQARRFPCKRPGVYTEHFVPRIFLTRTVCQVVLSGRHPSLTFHAFAWLKVKQCAFSKTVHTSRNMSYISPEMTSTSSPCTRTTSYPSARPTSTSPIVHSSEINPCHDPQQASFGYMADVPSTTGYEPKDLAVNADLCVLHFGHVVCIRLSARQAIMIAGHSCESRYWSVQKLVTKVRSVDDA